VSFRRRRLVKPAPCGFVGLPKPDADKRRVHRLASPRSGAQLHKPHFQGAEASGLERGARAGRSLHQGKPIAGGTTTHERPGMSGNRLASQGRGGRAEKPSAHRERPGQGGGRNQRHGSSSRWGSAPDRGTGAATASPRRARNGRKLKPRQTRGLRPARGVAYSDVAGRRKAPRGTAKSSPQMGSSASLDPRDLRLLEHKISCRQTRLLDAIKRQTVTIEVCDNCVSGALRRVSQHGGKLARRIGGRGEH
jgi:hypothetical protein